jgi:GrpB-like predicted nucleotidyltransferase (UPF0157 family)/quercetin dioxygenase-like cupin family protein
MDVFRFDEEESIPISQFGSRFRLAPLTGDGTAGRVQLAYLPPGGRVGRHPASSHQLFAVVAGRGWVAGQDGAPREITPGYAVRWHVGEVHEAGTDTGLTAVIVEGSFDVWAIGITTEIIVRDYDPAWPGWFERVCDKVWPAVGDIALRIDHVGSTSVPGLAAKPIIDMDIVVASDEDVHPVIERLATIGYRWRGDLGVEGRQAFKPLEEEGGLPQHHLYLVVDGSKAHLDHVLLRDLLREDPDARRRYAVRKRANVTAAAGDMDVYIAAKATLVAELLTRARAERGYPPAEYWTPERPTST